MNGRKSIQGLLAVFLSALSLFVRPGGAEGAWVKIWEVADMTISAPRYANGGIPPRDLNADGTLESVAQATVTGGAGLTTGFLIFDLAHGVPEYTEAAQSANEPVSKIVIADLDHDGIFEVLVQWGSRLECIKWNGIPTSPKGREDVR